MIYFDRNQQHYSDSLDELTYFSKFKIESLFNCTDYLLSVILSIFGIILFNLLYFSVADTRETYCGDPPPVADKEMKADIKGEAKLLLRIIGGASLSGSIEKSRKEIFSKYPDATMAYSNAFFLYMFCDVVFSDDKLSTLEKIEVLTKFKREFDDREYYKVSPKQIKELAQQSDSRKEITNAIEGQNYQNAAVMLFSDYYNMAKNDHEKKNCPSAIENYKQALKINPDHFGANYNLGDCYRNIGDIDQSLIAFQKSLEITPNNTRSYYNLANLYQQKGEDSKAKEHYKKVIELEPKNSSLSQRAKKNLQSLGE